MGASEAVKTALYNAVNELGYSTYTVVPQLADGGSDTDWPHVQIGAVTHSMWDTNDNPGFDFTARIYTRWRGGDEMPGLAIQDAIYGRLHRGALTITGYSLILLERQLSVVTPLEGSFSGVCEYRALIAET